MADEEPEAEAAPSVEGEAEAEAEAAEDEAAEEAEAASEAPDDAPAADGDESRAATPSADEAPMTQEEAALKIQNRARGMNARKYVRDEKGYETPAHLLNPGAQDGGSDEAAVEMTEAEKAAAEAKAKADEEDQKRQEEEMKKKSVDPEKCKVNVGPEKVSVTMHYLAAEDDTHGEPVKLSVEAHPLGKFLYSFEPEQGLYRLTALVEGVPIPGSPFKVWCLSSWKSTAMDHEEGMVFPPFMHSITAPVWIEDMVVVITERNPDPENEHSKPKLELYTMDRNGSFDTWQRCGLSDLPADQVPLPRRYGAACEVDDKSANAIILFGGVRDGVKDKDAKEKDPYPQVILQEPVKVLFQHGEAIIVPAASVEGPCPPAVYGHCIERIGSTFVLFGGCVADGESGVVQPTNDIYFLQLKDEGKGETWRWIKPSLSGHRPTPRSRAGMCIHRKKLFVYGGVDANGNLLSDVHMLEMGANPKWHTIRTSGDPPAGGAGVCSPVMCVLDDPDHPQCLVYGGFTSAEEEGAAPRNSVHMLSIDENRASDVHHHDHQQQQHQQHHGVWTELHTSSHAIAKPESVSSYHDGVFYNFCATSKPKERGAPFILDAIHQLMPASVMKPSAPSALVVVRDMGTSCVVSWSNVCTGMCDTFVNQYLLERDYGRIGSPFMQVYSGPGTITKVDHLEAGCLYNFRVRASNGSCLSEYSKILPFEATEPAPKEVEEEEHEEGGEEDLYEAWFEDETIRKQAEERAQQAKAVADMKKREEARDYHERLLDQAYIARTKLEEASDHYAALHAEIVGLLSKRDSAKTTEPGQKPVVEAGRHLNKVIQDVSDRLRELEAEEDNREATREQMQTRLDHKVAAAELVHQRFHNFKREIAMEAENSRSGRKIPEDQLNEVQKVEHDKDEELKAVRLKNIVLKHELARLESWLQSKEVLGEGLHLIDFEQLKIENQTLNEKIEERNEELLKLRKKNTQTVQVLTHIKEKLQFVQADNHLQKDNLANLETDLALRRDELAQHKKTLDQIRLDRYKLKEKSGLVDSDDLLYDFEMTKDRITDLKQQLKVLHQRAKTAQQHTKLVVEEQALITGGAPSGGMTRAANGGPLTFQ